MPQPPLPPPPPPPPLLPGASRYVEQMLQQELQRRDAQQRRAVAAGRGSGATESARVPRRSRITDALDADAAAVVQALQPAPGDAACRAEIVSRLQTHVDSVVPSGLLQLYGSSSCGLNASGADIDLTIQHPCGAPSHDQQKAIVQELASILGCRSSWAHVEAITASRVPIVTLVDAASGLHVDISVGNQLARLKTLLLASYAALDPRARALCFVVKRWARGLATRAS